MVRPMTFSKDSLHLARQVIDICAARKLRLASAESCTGGLISACLTEISGSSAVVDRGFVVYSNQAKHDLLGVPVDLIEQHGAVSEEVARAMAQGAVEHAGVNLAVAVTGIAGPGGGSAEKPVGLVHMALCLEGDVDHVRRVFAGDRQRVRDRTLHSVLNQIIGKLT